MLTDELLFVQDAVEDATAKAAVLPRFLSLPLVLWPCRTKRLAVSKTLSTAIDAAMAANPSGAGPWLRSFIQQRRPSSAPP